MKKGIVKNCCLYPRNDEYLFEVKKNGIIVPNLDGYTIIPNEYYEKLLKKDSSITQLESK